MDDNQLDLSDWEEPASQPDLSTNDSTFVPPAEEESDDEEPEVEVRQRRSKRKKTERWWTLYTIHYTLYTIQHWADPVNREKGNITHIGLLEADEDKILVAQVSPKGSTCA